MIGCRILGWRSTRARTPDTIKCVDAPGAATPMTKWRGDAKERGSRIGPLRKRTTPPEAATEWSMPLGAP